VTDLATTTGSLTDSFGGIFERLRRQGVRGGAGMEHEAARERRFVAE